MEIYPLLYFVTIADTGNLTQAARQLLISPPALSNALKRLEQNLGVPLFDRTGRSLILNKFGEAYLPYARKILELSRQSSSLMQQMREETRNHLHVADMTYVFASHLISEFLEQHPNISLRRSYVDPADAQSIDLEKTYDFAIGSTNSMDRPDLCSICLREGQSIVAIVHKSHSLAARSAISLQELAFFPMIAYAAGQPGRNMLERLFSAIQKQPSVVYEGNTPHAMVPALSRNLGVFIQPSHTARFNMRFYPDCVAIPICDAVYRANTSLLWSPARPQSESARLFAAFCRNYCTKIEE